MTESCFVGIQNFPRERDPGLHIFLRKGLHIKDKLANLRFLDAQPFHLLIQVAALKA